MWFPAFGEMARLKSPPQPRAGIQACLELFEELVRLSGIRFICMSWGYSEGAKMTPREKETRHLTLSPNFFFNNRERGCRLTLNKTTSLNFYKVGCRRHCSEAPLTKWNMSRFPSPMCCLASGSAGPWSEHAMRESCDQECLWVPHRGSGDTMSQRAAWNGNGTPGSSMPCRTRALTGMLVMVMTPKCIWGEFIYRRLGVLQK